MAKLNLHKIHEWKKTGSGQAVVDKVRRTARVSHATPPDKDGKVSYDPPIWVQDGKTFTEDMKEIKVPPFYFWEEVEKWDEKYRQEMNVQLPKTWDKMKEDAKSKEKEK